MQGSSLFLSLDFIVGFSSIVSVKCVYDKIFLPNEATLRLHV